MVHPFQTDDPQLRPIYEKVVAGTALERDEVTALYASKDILALGWLANHVREEKLGNATRLVVHEFAQGEADEILVVGDDPDQVCRKIEEQKRAHPKACISAYSVEQAAGSGAERVCRQLKQAGSDGFLGNGAELFHPAVRQRLWNSTSRYEQRAALRHAAIAAGLQVPLYLIQRQAKPADQAAELLTFREIANAASFAAISYTADATTSPFLAATTGMQEMKHIAIARLALANVAHIRAYWQMLGGKLLQIALRFGASDLDGTSLDPAVDRDARSNELAREIEVAGREPHAQPSSRKVIVVS